MNREVVLERKTEERMAKIWELSEQFKVFYSFCTEN